MRDGQIVSVTGSELLAMVAQARKFLAERGLKKGDRCALLAPNSIRWVALDLAMMAEGIIVVPLYARQAPAELVAHDEGFDAGAHLLRRRARSPPKFRSFGPQRRKSRCSTAFLPATTVAAALRPLSHANSDAADDHLHLRHIGRTEGRGAERRKRELHARLHERAPRPADGAGATEPGPTIFHYSPFCFAASWILLLTSLSRNSVLTLSTDLTKLSDELKLAAPDYFLNVPTLLERVRAKIEEADSEARRIRGRQRFRARASALIRQPAAEQAEFGDSVWLATRDSC